MFRTMSDSKILQVRGFQGIGAGAGAGAAGAATFCWSRSRSRSRENKTAPAPAPRLLLSTVRKMLKKIKTDVLKKILIAVNHCF